MTLSQTLVKEIRLALGAAIDSLKKLPTSGAFDRAAGIAYYAVLAVFPFVLILVLVGGRLLRNPELADQAIEFLSDRLPVAGDFLDDHLDTLQQAAGGLGTISALGLLWSAMGLFTALRNGMDAICGVSPKSLFKGYGASLAAVILSAIGLMLLIGLSTLLGVFGSMGAVQWLADLVPFLPVIQTISRYSGQAITILAFLFFLRFVPTSRPTFRDCVIPAVAVAFLEQIFRVLFVHFVLSRQDMNPVHGPLSAAIGFMGWCYASSLLILWASLWVHQIHLKRD